MTNKDQFPSLDQLDTDVIAELEKDPNQSYQAIADKLGTNRVTVWNRTQRMIDGGVIKPTCFVYPQAAGYKYNVVLTIRVQPGCAFDAAEKLASIDRVLTVYLCIGHFDLMVWVVFKTEDELLDFMSKELKRIPGLLYVETTLMLKGIKVWPAPVTADTQTRRRGGQTKAPRKLDDVDLQLIKELQRDARQNSVQLGQKIGVNQSTAFRRMQRLLDKHIIRIAVVSNPVALGYEGTAIVGLNTHPGKTQEVADAVAVYDSVKFVSTCTGQFDIMAWLVFRTQIDLEYFTNVELGNVPGWRDRTTMIIYKHVKDTMSVLR